MCASDDSRMSLRFRFRQGKSMGLVYGNFTLRNAREHGLVPKIVRALVDTGANILRIPATLATELQLEEVEKRKVRLPDGAAEWVPYVGPVEISFGKRHSFAGALVLGDEVLVGSIALRELDLLLVPPLETISVHPESPHIARGVARGVWSPA
jgi:clan AA aspartic protease